MAEKIRKEFYIMVKRDVKENLLDRITLEDFKKLTEKGREVKLKEIGFEARIELREMISYEMILEFQKFMILDVEAEALAARVELEEHNAFLENKQQECKEVEEKFMQAKRDLEKQKMALAAAKKFNQELEYRLKEKQKKCKEAKQDLNIMQEIVLVHASASYKQIYKNQLGKMIITQTDKKMLNQLLPDEIFDPKKAENFIQILPRGFEERYDEKKRESILDFCNLVINVKLLAEEDQKVVVLFSNKDIPEILRLNGIEDW